MIDAITYALLKGDIGQGTQEAVAEYLDEHLTNPSNPPIDTSLEISGAAADSKTTGDKITQLKEDLTYKKSNVPEEVLMVIPKGTFAAGSLNTDGLPYSSGYLYRICNTEFVKTSPAYTVYPQAGFRIGVHYYDRAELVASAHKAWSGWQTAPYTIETTYPYYKMVVARSPSEDGSETADVDDFLAGATKPSEVIENLDTLNKIIGVNLPKYWTTYLDTKASAINTEKANIGNHGDYFSFFTDYHAPQNKKYTSDILKYIRHISDIGMNVCGGDILTTHTKADAISVLSEFQSKFEGLDLFNLQGNHEQNPYASSSADKLNNWEYYPFLFKNEERNPAVSMTKYGYYYLDNDVQKIRYIFLNTKYSVTQFSIDTAQGNWFVSVLNSVPDGYGVVVLTHWFFGTVNADYTLTIDGIGTRIKEICDGYVNRATGTSAGIESPYDIPFDFTNAHGNMICVICGHTHNDYSIMSDAGYPIIACMCDAYQGSNQNPAYPRTADTVNEQAIDIFFINTTAKTVKTIRIGAGESTRSWSFI